MAGVAGRSGRRKQPGKVYSFTFYYRLIPGEDPPELERLLQSITKSKGRKRRDILRTALLGGAKQAQVTAEQTESSEIADNFDEMMADF